MSKVNKKNDVKKDVSLFNKEKVELMSYLNMDSDGTASLTGLWRYAGSPEEKRPNDWQLTQQGSDFISSVCKYLNTAKNHIIKSKRGKGGGTYGVRQIVLEYAKYLDTDLSVLVNEIFFQRIEEEKNPDLIIDRGIETYKRKGKSDEWITKRLKGKGKRNEFTSCLAMHGVEKEGFRNCTNAIYRPLYGGTTAIIRLKKNLSKGESIRDNMSEMELLATEFAEALSKESIEKDNLSGNIECEMACVRSSRIVAEALLRHGNR